MNLITAAPPYMQIAFQIRPNLFKVFILLLSFPVAANAQLTRNTTENTRTADSLFLAKNYLRAAKLYSSLFQRYDQLTDTTFYRNAASCYAMLGQADSSFVYLDLLANADFKGRDALSKDLTFIKISNDRRWPKILNRIKVNNNPLILPVAVEFEEILETYRFNSQLYELFIRRYGYESTFVAAFRERMRNDDSVMLYKVLSIVNTYGWKDRRFFGPAGPEAIMITMLHATPDIQKKYFSVMYKSALAGGLSANAFAILADQIALKESGTQIYGSQMHIVRGRWEPFPVTNMAELDARRKVLSLPSLKDYILHFDPKDIRRYCFFE